jgi:hypothetical protein
VNSDELGTVPSEELGRANERHESWRYNPPSSALPLPHDINTPHDEKDNMAETTIIQWGSKIPLRPSSGTNWCSLPANNYGTGTNIGYTSWCIHPCLHMPPSLSSSQKKRNELLTTIYHDIRNKDWSNPSIADQVDQSFTTRAKELWGGPNSDSENWILDGNWLDKRPDTVTWSRSTFWKNNKRKLRAAALGGMH